MLFRSKTADYSHVYVVVPKNQTTNQLYNNGKPDYYTIDCVINDGFDIEKPFVKHKDFIMRTQRLAGLGTPKTEVSSYTSRQLENAYRALSPRQQKETVITISNEIKTALNTSNNGSPDLHSRYYKPDGSYRYISIQMHVYEVMVCAKFALDKFQSGNLHGLGKIKWWQVALGILGGIVGLAIAGCTVIGLVKVATDVVNVGWGAIPGVNIGLHLGGWYGNMGPYQKIERNNNLEVPVWVADGLNKPIGHVPKPPTTEENENAMFWVGMNWMRASLENSGTNSMQGLGDITDDVINMFATKANQAITDSNANSEKDKVKASSDEVTTFAGQILKFLTGWFTGLFNNNEENAKEKEFRDKMVVVATTDWGYMDQATVTNIAKLYEAVERRRHSNNDGRAALLEDHGPTIYYGVSNKSILRIWQNLLGIPIKVTMLEKSAANGCLNVYCSFAPVFWVGYKVWLIGDDYDIVGTIVSVSLAKRDDLWGGFILKPEYPIPFNNFNLVRDYSLESNGMSGKYPVNDNPHAVFLLNGFNANQVQKIINGDHDYLFKWNAITRNHVIQTLTSGPFQTYRNNNLTPPPVGALLKPNVAPNPTPSLPSNTLPSGQGTAAINRLLNNGVTKAVVAPNTLNTNIISPNTDFPNNDSTKKSSIGTWLGVGLVTAAIAGIAFSGNKPKKSTSTNLQGFKPKKKKTYTKKPSIPKKKKVVKINLK